MKEGIGRGREQKEACATCPLKASCNEKKRVGHQITLHPYEEELRRAREEWEKPEVREKYRRRIECERLMHTLVRQGKRQTRSFGLQVANQQAHLVVATSNLNLLARQLALQEERRHLKAA